MFSDRPAGRSEDPYQRPARHRRLAAAVRLPAALGAGRRSGGRTDAVPGAARGGRRVRRGEGRRTGGHGAEHSRDAVGLPGQRGRRAGRVLLD